MNLSLLSFKVCSLLAQVQADERLMPFTDDRKYYVPWNPGYFEQGRQLLWNLIGTAFNIGIWIFILISGVYLILKIVDKFGG